MIILTNLPKDFFISKNTQDSNKRNFNIKYFLEKEIYKNYMKIT